MSRNYRIDSKPRQALLVARAVISLARPNFLLLGAGAIAGWMGATLQSPSSAAAHGKTSAHARCGSAVCLASYQRDQAEAKLRKLELEQLAWRTEKGQYAAEFRNVRRLLGVRTAAAAKEAPLRKWLGRAERVLAELRDTNHQLKQVAYSSQTQIARTQPAGVSPGALASLQGQTGAAEEP